MPSDWRRTAEAEGTVVRVDEIGAASVRDHDGRRPSRRGTPRHLAPWGVWQSEDNAGRPIATAVGDARAGFAALAPLLTGVHEFEARQEPRMSQVLADLAGGQHPQSLFLACADSRVVPNLITSSGPGDLFTVRNVGNLVPHVDDADSSVAAAIQYAVEVLQVPSIVVCGHSGCGAMGALLDGAADDDGGSALQRGLGAGRESVTVLRDGHPVRLNAEAAGAGAGDALAKVNVAVQVQRLAALPVVAAAVARGALQEAGLFFDIGRGRVEVLDPESHRFVAVRSAVEELTTTA